ncbi:sensor histidine kinase [Streptomyces sp. NPDC056149]|uniref:sensor histidine kinase n=1 Tax=Streptomyces sp. NPDC056149 TaxID=3345728 RepID=UPI0035E25106
MMTTRWREQQFTAMSDLTGRYVARLRLPALLPILFAGLAAEQRLITPWFFVCFGLYAAWALVRLALVHRQRLAGARGAVTAAAIDVVAVTVLGGLSGGSESAVRYAYFVLPMASVMWQRPRLTGWLSAACVSGYLAMTLPNLFLGLHADYWPVLVDEAYLLWSVGVCVLVAALLRRRSDRVAQLLDNRETLLRDALDAEERERARLADALHDGAVQNLFASLHDLEEAESKAPSDELDRASREIRGSVREIREVIYVLHPQVLAAAGLAAALESLGERLSRRGGFVVHYDLHMPDRDPAEALLFSVARELLTNVVKHAEADNVWLTLVRDTDEVVLRVRDDGKGFDTNVVQERLKAGHIGLASHYVRVESAGGTFSLDSSPQGSTTVEVRLPSRPYSDHH